MRTITCKAAHWVLAAVLSVAGAYAQSGPSEARLAMRSGIVELLRGQTWVPVGSGQWLKAGDQIRTGPGSIAAIELGLGKVVTLNERTQVRVGQGDANPAVQLESGNMKVFSQSEIVVSAKDTTLETAEPPLDLELGYQENTVQLAVFNGAVRSGPLMIRGGNQDPAVRTYRADGISPNKRNHLVPIPEVYVFPFFVFGDVDPNAGRIVPPVVNNPTHPAYRPTQIVPPMPNPLGVPVKKP